MLTIELGQGLGRERMESWFRYGTAVDPGNSYLYAQKLHYLAPQWHGSPEEMVAYGRELLAAKQWNLKLPLMLVLAYFQLAQSHADPSELYQADPQACRDVTAIYDAYLKQYPDAVYERSSYALTLYYCGQYAAANQQFKALGADGRIGPFVTRANYEHKRIDSATRPLRRTGEERHVIQQTRPAFRARLGGRRRRPCRGPREGTQAAWRAAATRSRSTGS
jgi:hypothetical protein